jgi:hypothetical protein
MVWVSIPTEKNDFLSASPGWSNAAAAAALAYSAHNLSGSAHNFPLATVDRGPPLVSIAAAIAEDENGEQNGMTATRRHIMGRETIEYNDSASRVKLFMVKETSSVSSGDQSSRTSTNTVPVVVDDSSSHRTSLFTQFTVLSPRLVKETEEHRRRRGGESNRNTKTNNAAAKKTEEENETRAKGRQLTSFCFLNPCSSVLTV